MYRSVAVFILVTFLFNSSDRLVQTNVASNEKKNEGIVARQFGTLNQLLTQKYE